MHNYIAFSIFLTVCYLRNTMIIERQLVIPAVEVPAVEVPVATTPTRYTPIIYTALGGKDYVSSRKNVDDLVYSAINHVPNVIIKLFVTDSVSDELAEFVNRFNGTVRLVKCKQLAPPWATTRFYCYYAEMLTEMDYSDRVAIVDSSDVVFLKNVFSKIDDDLYVVEEPAYFPMSKCKHHKKWIAKCPKYGQRVWESINHNPMLCAGAMFGTVRGFRNFLKIFTDELRETKCNDQGILNVLTYTNVIEPSKWTYDDNIVLNMNVAKDYVFDGAYLVHTGDNPKSVQVVRNRAEHVFKDVLSLRDSELSNDMLERLDHFLCEKKIPYVAAGGTLIGAVLYGGRIPWNDNMDIYISKEYLETLKSAIGNETRWGFQPSYNGVSFKIWDKRSPFVKNKRKYNWPYINVSILQHNSTHVWERHIGEKNYSNRIYYKECVFPPLRIRYEGFWISVPCDYEIFLNNRFGVDWGKTCVFSNWDHKLETVRYSSLGDGAFQIKIPCDRIKWIPSI